MIERDTEILILGAGFAGCLTAMILQAQGRRVLLIDRNSHPRFTIGESSTPTANLVLRDLCHRYSLTEILHLTKYGTWKETHPEITCGLKRGFSYFAHQPGEEFQAAPHHANELYVTASENDEIGDTQWLRSDVDAYFAKCAQERGIELLDQTSLHHATQNGNWMFSGHREREPVQVHTAFFLDATGTPTTLRNLIGIPSDGSGTLSFQTHSRAIYAHFRGVQPWDELMHRGAGKQSIYPFFSDASAQHHLLEEGWMWNLRFDDGVVSAGIVLKGDADNSLPSVSPEKEWRQILHRYPSLVHQFASADIIAPEAGMVRTGRLQRSLGTINRPGWAMLPHTAGFIDPLHSTGIAHSLCGIERLANCFEQHWRGSDPVISVSSALTEYGSLIKQELNFIDHLVAGCYTALPCFRLFAAYSMCYFAAATTYEHRRVKEGKRDAFLCADDVTLVETVTRLYRELQQVIAAREFSERVLVAYEDLVREQLASYNRVGLCDRAAKNLYRYTSAPE